MSLNFPEKLQELQAALHAQAKAKPSQRFHALYDKVYRRDVLGYAYERCKANRGAAGVDGQEFRDIEKQGLGQWLGELAQEMKDKTYRPSPVRRVYIPKPDGKKRPLGIPTIKDRVAQTAAMLVLEPIFEADLQPEQYAYRANRSALDAVEHVRVLLNSGHRQVVDADIRGFFDAIPHDRLMQEVRQRVADGPTLKMIEAFLKAKILEGLEQWTPMAGAPQGAVLSPLLSNIYLNPLDHLMAREGYEMVRYADDFVILCKSKEQAEQALERVRQWTAQAGLTLHPEKARIADAAEDKFEFLGFRFEKGRRWPRDKSKQKLRETIRRRTRRTNGLSLPTIIASINPVLRGWFGYFKHAHWRAMAEVNGWVRMRLRSILRKLQKRKGRGHGPDHRRWPNAFFAGLGLFSLEQAHRRERQSVQTAH